MCPTANLAALLLAAPLVLAQERPAPLLRLQAIEPRDRIAALAELAEGDAAPAAVGAVACALGDPDAAVRQAAVTTLLALRPDLRSLQGRLAKITADRTAAQRRGQLGVLGGRLAAAQDPTPYLPQLHDAKAAVRRRTVVAICRLGSAAAPHQEQILALLQDPVADVRAAVAKNVGHIGWNDAIRDAVLLALKDAAAVVRHGAAETLGQDRNDPGIVAALRGAVQDPDVDVRTMVVRSLGRCGAAGVAAAADVVASLRDREAKVRVAALEAVQSLKLNGDRAVRDSIRCLDDPDRKVLAAALRTVAGMQQVAAAALPRLLELTHHERGDLRRLALSAAYAVGVGVGKDLGAVVLRLVEALLDDDRNVEIQAQELLTAFVDGAGGDPSAARQLPQRAR